MQQMNVSITCEGCNRVHRLERTEFEAGEKVWLICHDCETPIYAIIPPNQAPQVPTPKVPWGVDTGHQLW